MSSKLLIAILLIAHFIVAQCQILEDSMKFAKMLNAINMSKERENKNPRCFAPNRLNCGGPANPNSELELYRWYYSTVSQACEPMYMPRDQKIFCSAMTELPTTKLECEDLCGEPCTVVYANKKTEPGVCMGNEYCQIPIPPGVPEPCQSYSRCCPKGYVQYSTTTPEPGTNN